MKKLILILTLFLLILNPCFAQSKTIKKDLTVSGTDGFVIKAELEYPKMKGKRVFSTIVLLHSLGYSSGWWGNLPAELLNSGYAVLKIDLRGHGNSVYNKRLTRISWKDMTNQAYAKYPDDVLKVIEQVKSENNRTSFFDDWALVGCDIGANTAILVADKASFKPKTIVMLSPGANIKGLYIPVRLANLDNIDILSIIGTNDITGAKTEEYLKRFAQAAFVNYTSTANASGMLLLKNDTSLTNIIATWLKQYL